MIFMGGFGVGIGPALAAEPNAPIAANARAMVDIRDIDFSFRSGVISLLLSGERARRFTPPSVHRRLPAGGEATLALVTAGLVRKAME